LVGNRTQAPIPLEARLSLSSLDWNRSTLRDVYDRLGTHKPSWDASAREALDLFAKFSARAEDMEAETTVGISNAVSKAMRVGCQDPLVLYLYARFCIPNTGARQEEIALAYQRAAEALRRTEYPPIRKFYSFVRAANRLRDTPGMLRREGGLEAYNGFVDEGRTLFLQALDSDPGLPAREAFELAHTVLYSGFLPPEEKNTNYFAMEKRLFAGWPNHPLMHLLKGTFYRDYAWEARGPLLAMNVTEEGWMGMRERLTVAEQSLLKAWEGDPTDFRVANQMLRVELLQGQGRERFELWFDRAMTLNPSNDVACMQKILYLSTAYYGSPGDILKFGRECAATTRWTGNVPLVLPEAHAATAFDEDYWKDPAVWIEIKSCFEKFFAANPQNKVCRQNYARFAYRCEQWDDLAEQIDRIGPEVNYTYFGGKHVYLGMVKKANTFKRRGPEVTKPQTQGN
jgi:hypothetical protein